MSLTATVTDPVSPPDELLASAVELARAAAAEVAAPQPVGAHVGCVSIPPDDGLAPGDAAPVAAHLFGCTSEAYSGWSWSVALTRAPGSERVTVDEVALQPGEQALLPPPWVPWDQRVRPGDLGAGDVLPTPADDERLVPGYTLGGDPAVDDAVAEFGLGRVRVMSRLGRADAAARWYDGPTGPEGSLALQAPAHCGTCGFYLHVSGVLSGLLGVCGNELSPADGRVVAVEHGCGAHSEAVSEPEPPLTEVPYDTAHYDVLDADVEPVTVEAGTVEAGRLEPETGPAN